MKSFSKSVAVLATVALAQTGDEFENYNLNLEEIADILGAYDLGEYGNDYGTNYGGQVESSAEDAPVTAEELLNVDYNTVETTEVIGEYEEAIDGQGTGSLFFLLLVRGLPGSLLSERALKRTKAFGKLRHLRGKNQHRQAR